MSDLTIPTEKISVTVHFDGEAKLEGIFFTGPTQINKRSSQKVASLLEEKNPFIPFLVRESGRAELINKSSIKAVEWEYHDDKEEELSGLEHTENVTVTFIDGTYIRGTLISDVPIAKSRLSDCLNQKEDFLNITVGTKHFHVNKAMLRKVVDK